MPMITVQLGAEPSAEITRSAARIVTDLTASILHKDPNVTAVAVQYISPTDWFIAGKSLHERRAPSFFVDTRISDGTNSKNEKAAYVAAIFNAMSDLLSGAHPESYVHADDVRADAYGYAGVTQERRYIESSRPTTNATAGP